MSRGVPFRSGLWCGDLTAAGRKHELLLDLRFVSGDVFGYGHDAVDGGFLVSGSFQSSAPFSIDVAFAYGEDGSTHHRALSGFRSAEDGGAFGQWCSTDDAPAPTATTATAASAGTFILAPVTDDARRTAVSAQLKEAGGARLARQALERWFPREVCEAALASAECLEDAAAAAAKLLAMQNGAAPATGGLRTTDEQIAAIMELGFSEMQARQALLATGSVELASELLLTQLEDAATDSEASSMASSDSDDDEDVDGGINTDGYDEVEEH